MKGVWTIAWTMAMKRAWTIAWTVAVVMAVVGCGAQRSEAQTTSDIGRLCEIRDSMERNRRELELWKNLSLMAQAMEIVESIPEEGTEYDAYRKACLIDTLMGCCTETDMARGAIRVREYQLYLLSRSERKNADMERKIEEKVRQWRDYTDESLGTDEYRERYGVRLAFDAVERTARYEEILPEAEAKIRTLCPENRWQMGYCYIYWEKKAEVLREYGIEWESPAVLNPEVMFD